MTYKGKNIKYTKAISRGKCFFTLEDEEDEDMVYEVPIKKCEEVEYRIKEEINSYNKKRRKIMENLVRDAAIIGTIIIITTSNGVDPLYDLYENTKNKIKRILEENSNAKYKKF
jgi:NAD-dependent SIR2 family protein deacetylase